LASPSGVSRAVKRDWRLGAGFLTCSRRPAEAGLYERYVGAGFSRPGDYLQWRDRLGFSPSSPARRTWRSASTTDLKVGLYDHT